MDSNSGEQDYDHDDFEYEEDDAEWSDVGNMVAPSRMRMQYHQEYQMMQRPTISSERLAPQRGVFRKVPHIMRRPIHLRTTYNRPATQQHLTVMRPIAHPVRLVKMARRDDHPRSRIDDESSSHEAPYLGAYANEETVRTTSEKQEVMEEEEVDEGEVTRMNDHSMKRLEDDLEVDVEGISDGPSTSMPKMIIRKNLPVFHPSENKALIENHQLKTRLAQLIDSNCRFREEVSQLREEKRELIKQIQQQERTMEKHQMELALAENTAAELRRKDKEMTKKFEKEMALRDKRKKTSTVMPCLPNRKVVFSKATKQAQALRLRLLHRYLSELVGPIEGEHRLEEKNLIVLRWRKAHAPKPSLEIGRQLLPTEEEEFCRKFGITGETKKEMKNWLGKKHIDLFGPSERAIAVRKWRMVQRAKKRRGETVQRMIDIDERILDEVGNDTDDDDLIDDVGDEMDQTPGMESSSCDISVLPSGTIDDIEEGTE